VPGERSKLGCILGSLIVHGTTLSLRVAPILERRQFSNVKFSAGHSQIFEYHQLRFDELVKNFLNYPETCSSLRRRVGRHPQAVMRKRGCAPSRTTQVSRPVGNAPVSMLIRFGSTSGRSLGVCP
jgi:hypothetical protein